MKWVLDQGEKSMYKRDRSSTSKGLQCASRSMPE